MAKNALSEKKEFFGRAGKMGTYTVVVSLILLAALVVVNLIVAKIPATYTQFDSSSSKMYTLSETTQEFIPQIDTDITLYYVCQGGSENTSIRTFLDRYTALSSRIKIKVADPVADPNFLSQYNAESVSNYSVIVVSGERYKAVDYSDMYYYYNENVGQMSASEYSYYGEYYASYYGDFTEYFEGDNLITGAIEYVTAESVPTIYLMSGHGETELSETVTGNLFDYSGVTYDTLNIALDGEEIPGDCDCLIINAPTADITGSEADKLISYLKNGGKIILLTAPGCESYTNLMQVTEYMGMKAVAGTVSEGDSSKHYSRAAQYIYPDMSSENEATSNYSSFASQYNISFIMPYAHGIQSTDASGVTFTPLMTTSDRAYTSEDETKASYNLAAVAESGYSKLLWIGSSQMLTDTFINGTNGGNYYCFYYLFNWMQDGFTSSLAEISGIEMSEPIITVSESQANIWGVIFIFIIPGAVIGGGLIYWLKRRKA